MNRKYNSLYERLVANTRLEREDDATSCWLWTGPVTRAGYPRLCLRNKDGQPRLISATRAMLEEYHKIDFPFDEAGHLCGNPLCVSPLDGHLEVQTRALNMLLIPGMSVGAKLRDACLIPVLFPRVDTMQEAVDRYWEARDSLPVGGPCPF